MTCTELIRTAAAARLTIKNDGKREWSAPYQIRCDSAADDAIDVEVYLAAAGIEPGATLAYGSTTDLTVTCQSIELSRQTGAPKVWEATATYATLDGATQSAPGHDGGLSYEPTDWRYQITTSSRFLSVPAWGGWNIDPFPWPGKSSSYRRAAETYGPVVNSAGVPYDPPLMRDTPEIILRVSGCALDYDPDDLLIAGEINTAPIRFHSTLRRYYSMVGRVFPPNCVCCVSAGADAVLTNTGIYWRYTYEFGLRNSADALNPQDGYLESILDRGASRAAGAADPDGRGGFISASDIQPGQVPVAAITTVDGNTVSEPVLLDGAGQPLESNAEPIFFRWRIHPHGTFLSLPLQIWELSR